MIIPAEWLETLTVTGPDGTNKREIKAVVSENSITTRDASIPVEVGDKIERELPHGAKETLSATQVHFQRGFGGIPSHYTIKTRAANPRADQVHSSAVSVYVSESPQARVNLHSVDNSHSAINTQSNEAFEQTRQLIQGQIGDSQERERLLRSVDDMETAHQSGDFAAAYKRFVGLAADHISVLAPVIPALASLL